MTSVRLSIDPRGKAATVELIDAYTARVAGRVRDDAKRIIYSEGRIDTGAMAQQTESLRVRKTLASVTYRVENRAPYALPQHNGVQGPVRPRTAKFLRFKPKGSSVYVFARETKGFDGIFFLTRALDREASRG